MRPEGLELIATSNCPKVSKIEHFTVAQRLTKTLALEFGEAGEDFSFSTAYTGSAEAAARPKYIDFPADAEVVKRLRKVAIL